MEELGIKSQVNVAVCDDSKKMTEEMESLVAAYEVPNILVEKFTNGSALEERIFGENAHFDIYLLDIEMPNMSGIELAAKIRKHNELAVIIFITSHDQYARDAFQVEPLEYIDKPINKEVFMKIFDKAYDRVQKRNTHFKYKLDKELYQIPFERIMYFKSLDRKVMIHLSGPNEVRGYYGKISDVLDFVDRREFVQIHRSTIVNIKYVGNTNTTTLKLICGGQPLSIGATFKKNFESCWFKRFFEE